MERPAWGQAGVGATIAALGVYMTIEQRYPRVALGLIILGSLLFAGAWWIFLKSIPGVASSLDRFGRVPVDLTEDVMVESQNRHKRERVKPKRNAADYLVRMGKAKYVRRRDAWIAAVRKLLGQSRP